MSFSEKLKKTIRKRAPIFIKAYKNIKLRRSKNNCLYIKHQLEYDSISFSKLFDASYYLTTYPDVADTGIDPLLHYLQYGREEGRDPTSYFSSKKYMEQNIDVAGSGVDPFYHWVVSGRFEGRLPQIKGITPNKAVSDGLNSAWGGYHSIKARLAFYNEENKADVSLLSFCHHFKGSKPQKVASNINLNLNSKLTEPVVSIVIPCMNQGVYTLECIASIASSCKTTVPYEVIIVDNDSEDPIYQIIKKMPGIKYLRQEKNMGFGEACNIGAHESKGKYILFLNNDAQLMPVAINAFVNAYESGLEHVGIIGPKVLSFDGVLQEGGCCLSPDGSGELIGFGRDHREPRFNYRREVEYISGVALFISKEDFIKVEGFDPIYSPAYCEDADLCLKIRKLGKKIYYEPAAIIAHHLSVTSNNISNEFKQNLAIRNKQKLVNKWQSELCEDSIRLIAFYLPQYHPIPENDRWWGKGFTEWRNVTKTKPNYAGHNQPRIPEDLGYYDLRAVEVMEQQASLAKRYGLAGFCYYYYWFNGKKLLDMPIERMLKTGKPNMPFCLCWANENWTRTWDGQENDALIEQKYSEENDIEVIKDLSKYFTSDNYISVNGKPLILIYRVKEFPNFQRTAKIWRNYCNSIGIDEICIAMVESFELSASPEDPKTYGCDISVEFPPHGMVHDQQLPLIDKRVEFKGAVHDYENLVMQYMTRKDPGFKRLRSVLVGWDNTPRRQDNSLILENATPGAFQAWLEWTIKRTKEQNFGDERIVFINAWNEWCEGSYLEPDNHYGHAYLQTLKNALDSSYDNN